MEIPKSIKVNTGEQREVQPKIDAFFKSIYEDISTKDECSFNHSDFEIKLQGLYDYPETILNDKIHYCSYKGRVVGIVIEARTEHNYVNFDFFRKNLENLLD
ncbi:hypothetical protein BMS3Abin17_01359 [archaeon BMS3Abin17]|nr:hypothetical protein BMS3Abin17_01359 [archaeon BMS3Abin17]HDZ60911.1 hypothetical protein [Candidatus Pacearchaeota archaeon]